MLEKFKTFIRKEELLEKNEKVLVAISGGIDSMVMLHLFQQYSENSFVVAHCNFKLRSKESDQDEQFVTEYCKKHQIHLFIKHFNTEEYANKKGISIQMAARELRYRWFDELAEQHHFEKIALAQHLDDQTETFFINLMRGTGIVGLHGILPKNKKLIRPLLFADRKMIINYQQAYNIPYREDSSNDSDKYLRNFIRHNISPLFEKLSPGFSFRMNRNIKNLRDVETIYKQAIDRELSGLIIEQEGAFRINIEQIRRTKFPEIYLKEILFRYDFNLDTIYNVYEMLNNPKSGKVFENAEYRLLIDRKEFIITKKKKEVPYTDNYKISKDENIEFPIKLRANTLNKIPTNLKTSRNTALFDADKLKFPLTLRKWKEGDYFYPFGMRGKKKLSDFFTDHKLSVLEKENLWILESGEDIIWVIGYRTDNRYRINKNTKRIYKMEYYGNS